MHLIRRSVFRAITSPSTSLLSKSCLITTSSPFVIQPKLHATISPISRRFASDDAEARAQEIDTKSTPSSADGEDQSSIASAISSATASTSAYASNAAENLTKNASAAKDTVVDTASGVAQAAGLAYASRDNYNSGSRTPQYNDRGIDVNRPVSRILKPTNSVYIGNLLFEITEQDLEREFGEYGNMLEVKVARDSRGLSKGFAYITYETIEAATAAIKARDQTVLDGRHLLVNYQIKTSYGGISNPPSKTLFIGNLAFEMSDADLNRLFKDIKNVLDVRVAIDRRTGQPRGFAHADFVDVESSAKALEFLKGKEFYGRQLRVDYALSSPRSAKPERAVPGNF